jgi:hypothetical protein
MRFTPFKTPVLLDIEAANIGVAVGRTCPIYWQIGFRLETIGSVLTGRAWKSLNALKLGVRVVVRDR